MMNERVPEAPGAPLGPSPFQHRVTTIMLMIVVAIGGVISMVAVAHALGWTAFAVGQPHRAPTTIAVCVSLSTLALAVLAECYRRGAAWAVRAATLVLVIVLLPSVRTDAFDTNIPQVVWLPTLLAFATSNLRWSLFVAALTAAWAALLHGGHRALHTPAPLLISALILVILVSARIIEDRLLEDARAQADRVHRLALFDELTGLPNRRLLTDRLNQALKKAERDKSEVAVLFVDLDHFKEVNDTLGHGKGDLVLIEAVARIRTCVRASDTLARFGSDEFILVLGDVSDRAAVDRIAAAINHRLAEAFVLGEEQIFASASIGVSLYPADGAAAEDLLRHADQALFVAKESGRNRCVYFTAKLHEDAEERARLAHDLRTAISGGQLRVHYQPIVELAIGAIHKAEALVRWYHPTRGLISPAVFIPIAEATGLIHDIGDWVFREAVDQVTRWREAHTERFQISVNRSPAQFRVEGSDRIFWPKHLSDRGLAGDAIVLEITEGLLIDDARGVAQHLDALRSAGIGVSLDDFGTGYSALAYLHKYPIDYVKIDQSFVREMGAASKHLSLCKAIIVMAHELGMKVVAEGVETEAQRALLLAAGRDYAQGYLFSRPMASADLEPLLVRAAG